MDKQRFSVLLRPSEQNVLRVLAHEVDRSQSATVRPPIRQEAQRRGPRPAGAGNGAGSAGGETCSSVTRNPTAATVGLRMGETTTAGRQSVVSAAHHTPTFAARQALRRVGRARLRCDRRRRAHQEYRRVPALLT